MGLAKLLIEGLEDYKKEQQYYLRHRGHLNNIVSEQELEAKALEFIDDYFEKPVDPSKTVDDVIEDIFPKLGEWHRKYEDDYYDIVQAEDVSYDNIMGFRQEKALQAHSKLIEDMLQNAVT